MYIKLFASDTKILRVLCLHFTIGRFFSYSGITTEAFSGPCQTTMMEFFFFQKQSAFSCLSSQKKPHHRYSTGSKMFLFPAGIYMFKVSNRNTRTRCEIGSKLTIKTAERCHWRLSGVFIVNFEHILHLVLVFLLLPLNI